VVVRMVRGRQLHLVLVRRAAQVAQPQAVRAGEVDVNDPVAGTPAPSVPPSLMSPVLCGPPPYRMIQSRPAHVQAVGSRLSWPLRRRCNADRDNQYRPLGESPVSVRLST
jgi:hypothetical protein